MWGLYLIYLITNKPLSISEAAKQIFLETYHLLVYCFITFLSGCRAGADCPFIHDDSRAAGNGKTGVRSTAAQPQQQPQASEAPSSSHIKDSPVATEASQATPKNPHRQYTQLADQSRVVQRPTPRTQAEDPRAFQIGQVRRRFAADEQVLESKTIIKLNLTPSDPDFPFEMDALEVVLTVPQDYPRSGSPSLRVKNKGMDRGYQINIEKGFVQIATEYPQATLLNLLNLLDKQLEYFLAAPKAETIKLVANLNKTASSVPESSTNSTAAQGQATGKKQEARRPSFSDAHKDNAAQIRTAETRQLEARLGRLPLFNKSLDGYTYMVPIEPRKPGELPASLPPSSIKVVQLHVPHLYNLEPCSITLVGVEGEAARNVESAFLSRVSQNSHFTLMNHINYLSQNVHTMAKTPATAQPVFQSHSASAEAKPTSTAAGESKTVASAEDHRSHIVTIPRPPEWTAIEAEDAGDSYDSYSYDSGDETEDEDVQEEPADTAQTSKSTAERGIMLSLPFLELHGIELLELVSLSITVKCDRCKDTMDVANVRNNTNADASGIRSVSCKKCANQFGIGLSRVLNIWLDRD